MYVCIIYIYDYIYIWLYIYMIIYVFMAAAKNVRRRIHTPERRCLVPRFMRYPYISKGYDPVLSQLSHNMYTLWVISIHHWLETCTMNFLCIGVNMYPNGFVWHRVPSNPMVCNVFPFNVLQLFGAYPIFRHTHVIPCIYYIYMYTIIVIYIIYISVIRVYMCLSKYMYIVYI